MANTTTRKSYGGIKSQNAGSVEPPKSVNYGNRGGKSDGQLRGNGAPEKFAEELQAVTAPIKGIGGLHNDIGEMSGFITDGYLDKGGVPYGEAAKFNFLPPGMEITNQENAEIHDMPMRRIVSSESYPGDGWSPAPRDIPE